MGSTNAEPEQHHVPVHGYCGFLVRGSSGHPHPGTKGPVNEEAISLPSSARSSPQTPREGLGKEEDMRQPSPLFLLDRPLWDNQVCLSQKHHGSGESKALVLERRHLQNQHPVLHSQQGRAAPGEEDGLCCKDQLLRGLTVAVNLALNFTRCSTDFNAILVKQWKPVWSVLSAHTPTVLEEGAKKKLKLQESFTPIH